MIQKDVKHSSILKNRFYFTKPISKNIIKVKPSWIIAKLIKNDSKNLRTIKTM